MLGKDFGLGAAEPYYFKFIANSLELTGEAPDSDSVFRFLVYKGNDFKKNMLRCSEIR